MALTDIEILALYQKYGTSRLDGFTAAVEAATAPLLERIAALTAERDEADRRAGNAERTKQDAIDDMGKCASWLDKAKHQWGVDRNVSFDVVWAECLALKPKVAALEAQVEQQSREHVTKDAWRRLAESQGELLKTSAQVEQAELQSGNWIAADDYRENVKALDVALNGDGGAERPALIDILAQVEQVARRFGMPVLTALEASLPQEQVEQAAQPVFWAPPERDGAFHHEHSSELVYRVPMSGWRPLYTSPPKAAPLTEEQQAILSFLGGSGPLDGAWFGDKHPTEKGMYWWRKRLWAAFGTPATVEKG